MSLFGLRFWKLFSLHVKFQVDLLKYFGDMLPSAQESAIILSFGLEHHVSFFSCTFKSFNLLLVFGSVIIMSVGVVCFKFLSTGV